MAYKQIGWINKMKKSQPSSDKTHVTIVVSAASGDLHTKKFAIIVLLIMLLHAV